jgi:hypothetical protein
MGLYKSVVDVVTPYLGLGAQKFVERQVKAHIGIQPDELEVKHLDELAKWCFISGKLILQDNKAAEEIRTKLLRLKK